MSFASASANCAISLRRLNPLQASLGLRLGVGVGFTRCTT